MGNTTSNIVKTPPAIAMSNTSAPGVLRLYSLEDHVFPYKASQPTDSYPSVHLAASLNGVEKSMSDHLCLSPRLAEITRKEVDIYQNVINREEMARGILMKSDRASVVHYNSAEDRGQVYMCRQFIVEITEDIDKIKDLRILQACCNYLTTLPSQIGSLVNLKVLVLSKNRIQRLPEEVGLLKNLRELNLSQNMLFSLPEGISSLKALNALHIDNNLFTTLPTTIGRLHSLKYLNISNNRIQNIPLEILKLPFLIELTATACDFVIENRVEVFGQPTLKETCSRHVVRNNLEIHRDIDEPLARYLRSVQECSFCGGPLFEQYYLHRSIQNFDSERFPVMYKLCTRHYSTHEDRIAALFAKPLETYPHRLMKSNMPFVSELFNSMNYSDAQNRVLNNALADTQSGKMPLICLSRLKTNGSESGLDNVMN